MPPKARIANLHFAKAAGSSWAFQLARLLVPRHNIDCLEFTYPENKGAKAKIMELANTGGPDDRMGLFKSRETFAW